MGVVHRRGRTCDGGIGRQGKAPVGKILWRGGKFLAHNPSYSRYPKHQLEGLVLGDVPGSCAMVRKETEASSMQRCTHAMGMHMLDIQEATTFDCISRVSFPGLHQKYYILPGT